MHLEPITAFLILAAAIAALVVGLMVRSFIEKLDGSQDLSRRNHWRR